MDLTTIPSTPGIYIYRDQSGQIIYVGKAINLKKRVSQYFQRDDALGPKTKTLVSQIASIETKQVGSEIEALILESSLIKKYHPKYNSSLKDDKSYQYICITRDVLPRIYPVFQSNLPGSVDLYGPFPNGTAIKSLLRTIRHIFPYYGKKKHPITRCLYCHLGICPGPDPDPVRYRQNIGKIKKILSGHFKTLQKQLKREMDYASKENNYETALQIRDQLRSIEYIVSGWHNLSNLFDQINLPDDQSSSAILELETTLKPYLPLTKINRIECYDISQMGTRHFVGAMTVWQNGHIAKSEYRKFKINTKVTADDQFMIKEIVYRRLQHPEWQFPDLIVVDGGKPQVSAATSITDLPIIGLAKKFETIVLKSNNNFVEISLPKGANALRLLCALRDEAHRFANRFRKELMSKSIR